MSKHEGLHAEGHFVFDQTDSDNCRVVAQFTFPKDARGYVEMQAALESIVKLMISMQSLGYFTNDEWQSRLTAAQAALRGTPCLDEIKRQIGLDSGGEQGAIVADANQ